MTTTEPAPLSHAGADLIGEIFRPTTAGPHPAVLVMHDAHGLGDPVRAVARRLADRGYAALATDMYGGGRHHPTREQAGMAAAPLWADPDLLRRRVVAWYELLRDRPEVDGARIAAIGYCFGGRCVLDLARSGVDAKVVISHHGLLTTQLPARPGAIKAHVAIYTGACDPYAPRAEVDAFRDEMTAAGASWDITLFGNAAHAFTDPGAATTGLPGLAYDPRAERLSWAGTLVLLDAFL